MIDPNVAVGAGLALMAIVGPAIGIGMVGSKVLEGIARQPEVSGNLSITGLLFAAFIEALGLSACLVGFKMIGLI